MFQVNERVTDSKGCKGMLMKTRDILEKEE